MTNDVKERVSTLSAVGVAPAQILTDPDVDTFETLGRARHRARRIQLEEAAQNRAA